MLKNNFHFRWVMRINWNVNRCSYQTNLVPAEEELQTRVLEPRAVELQPLLKLLTGKSFMLGSPLSKERGRQRKQLTARNIPKWHLHNKLRVWSVMLSFFISCIIFIFLVPHLICLICWSIYSLLNWSGIGLVKFLQTVHYCFYCSNLCTGT